MAADLITKEVRCVQCGKPMAVLLGIGAPGLFRVDAMVALEEMRALHGSFQCHGCSHYYCWECSDAGKTCKCGQQSWRECQYLDADFARKNRGALVGSTSHGSPSASRPFEPKHPGLVLAAGLAFYALAAYGLITGQMLPKPEHKALWYVMNWLPVAAVFWGARKLGLSVLIAGLLALAGPAVLTWAFWFHL